MRRYPVLWMLGGLALTACSLAPHYVRPAVEPPAAYAEASGWKLAAPADASTRGAWWQRFAEPELDQLETRLVGANQNLKAAVARLREAHDVTRVARTAYLPRISLGSTATRSQTSLHSPSYSASRPDSFDDLVAGGYLSYELDLFGRIRNTAKAAKASEQATAGDVASLELTLRAELAVDYFSLRALDTDVELLDHAVADYVRALALTQHLYDAGAAARSDVQQAIAQVEFAKTQAAETRLHRAQMEHALAVLVGEAPANFHLAAHPLSLDRVLPVIDPELPSSLLERRPDIAAAERRVAAANAGIGIARAAFFPDFSLSGVLGRESSNRSTWFEAPSRFWSVGPQTVLTVFDAGAHRAQADAAHAALDEQVANYRNTVLTAFQEVEDNLAALRQLEQESQSAAAAVQATDGALTQANFRYQAGIVTYLEVVSTENAALSAHLAAIDIETRRITATVLLIRALGGDWAPTRSAVAR